MGSNKDKLEKKRLKAQIKLEKKRAKQDGQVQAAAAVKKQTKTDLAGKKVEAASGNVETVPAAGAQVPWYKNPDWLRAIAGIASLIVAIIAIIITFSK